VAAGRIAASEIDERAIGDRLFTAGIPDPDLLIRTSGEKRISNFLLWQSAYTELVFLDALWPDFSREHLSEAIRDFQGRERRYGAIG
jgi:undecaprenyl diphosphate synthase